MTELTFRSLQDYLDVKYEAICQRKISVARRQVIYLSN